VSAIALTLTRVAVVETEGLAIPTSVTVIPGLEFLVKALALQNNESIK
jgi:hypothetical protein